jgi:cbb3-type cytochrome oxidase maturation protein
MIILYLLIPLSLMLVGFGVWAFFWAVRQGQFDDLSSPAASILLDDDRAPPPLPPPSARPAGSPP